MLSTPTPRNTSNQFQSHSQQEEEVEESEYDRMDLDMLKEVVPMLEQQLEASKTQRNWTQLERDTVQTFYDVTRKEVAEVSLPSMA